MALQVSRSFNQMVTDTTNVRDVSEQMVLLEPDAAPLFVLTNALTGGRRAGFAATAGIMLAGAFHALWGGISVVVLLTLPAHLFSIMLFAGAAYMAWIGISLLRSAITINTSGSFSNRSSWVAFRQGAVTGILNPKAYLFIFAVFPQFMKPQYGNLWPQAPGLHPVIETQSFRFK